MRYLPLILLFCLILSVPGFGESTANPETYKQKVLGCPGSILPAGGYVPLQPVISWDPVEGATQYHVRISIINNFSYSEVDVEGIVGTKFKVEDYLQPLTIYFLKVAAGDSRGYNESCAYGMFMTWLE